MWFLPSYGRPELIRAIAKAPGGVPPDLIIICTSGDPKLQDYRATSPFPICVHPNPDARLCDLLNWVVGQFPDKPFYGFLSDDHCPLTPGWWTKLEKAAKDKFIAVATGIRDTSPLGGVPCFGGLLIKSMGYISPPGFRHNWVDNAWQQIASDFNLLREVDDVKIKHNHWITKDAKQDATYHRGSDDMSEDAKTFQEWIGSSERLDMNKRIAAGFGIKMSMVDMSKIKLAICLPLHDCTMDMILIHSLDRSIQFLMQMGTPVHKFITGLGSNIGKAREKVMNMALRSNCTHIMFVDHDMGWDDHKLIAHLLASGHDFTGVMGVKKADELAFCGNFEHGDGKQVQHFHPDTNFLRIMDVGFGLVIIKREVFEKMIAAYPELQYDTDDDKVESALFIEMIDKDKDSGKRTRLSEDLSFCRRWTKIGGEIFIDHQVAMKHVGRKEYTGRVADIFNEVEKAPIDVGVQENKLEAAE